MPSVRLPVVAALILSAASFACSDGGEAGADGPGGVEVTTTVPGAAGGETADLEALSGGAPAASGAGLDTAPGPADRVAIDVIDVDGLGVGEVAVALTGPDGEVVGWCVLVAGTSEQRQRGLMEVTDLGGYDGMLFVWDADVSSAFYMRNTPTPLRIAWFDAAGDLVSTADMQPCDDVAGCPTYPPAGRYRFALEVPQGSPAADRLVPDATLAAGGACRART